MAGFKLLTSDAGSKHSAICALATAQCLFLQSFQHHFTSLIVSLHHTVQPFSAPASVTRFSEILLVCQFFKSLWSCYEALFIIWQTVELTLAIFECQLGKYLHGCKMNK